MLQANRGVPVWILTGVLYAGAFAWAQNPSASETVETGQATVNGHTAPYRIRLLPASSFPDLPQPVADALQRRGCLIPQTYEAHRPENVIHASLERPGSQDWAVLCSVKGTVSLLAFFASDPEQPRLLATAPEIERLQAHDVSGVLGFNWAIDPATPQQIRANQAGMEHRPPPVDHDALADSIVDRRTVYRFFVKNTWTILDAPE